MRIIYRLVGVLVYVSLGACVSLNSASLTNIPRNRSDVVQAKVEKDIFLFLNFDNSYAYGLSAKLQKQCRGGVVSGILTKTETVCYPLCLYLKHRITARGYCQR